METSYLNHVAHKPYCCVLDEFEEWEINRNLLKLEFYITNPGEVFRQSTPTEGGYRVVKAEMQDQAVVVEEFLLRVFEVRGRL
jgi:hypothetical protein